MDYSDSNITLSDSLSGYITANEGECDNSRYLSVLSHDLTLQEMNVALSDEQIEEDNGTELLCTEENQPLIFTVDGTNEIYGIQMAQDEDGNLRKYQIQYSETMNGELVPMLETIQLLPLDYEEQVISAEETYSSSELSQSNDTFVITNDEFISHNSKNHFNMNKNMRTEEQNHIQGDVKRLNIPSTSVTSNQAPVKNEPEELFDRSSGMETANGNENETQNSIRLKEEAVCGDVLGMEDDESTVVAIQHLEFPQSLEQEELYEETIEEKHFEQLFLEENHIIDTSQLIRNDIIVGDDQQNELYQVLNTVASNPENVYDHSMHTILKETVDHPKTNILKKPIQKSLLKDFINTEQKIVYVHTLPEKENLTLMDIESFTKPSSRSLLKCNQPTELLEQSDHLLLEDEHPQKNLCTKAVSRTKELKQPQTYLRTKEAKQAQQFLNFINSTTIPQVPERKGRLPRKQQIKPVKHPDEDIVVKEMIVSSNSFIEPISAEERKYLPVTEYVELIDSGDERCNNKKKRKSNDQDEFIEIEISDTDESDIGVVELEPITNGKLEKEATNGIKKKRGRPPKNQTSVSEKKDAYPNSPPKISRLDSDVESVTSTLQVIRMENDEENASDSAENPTKYQNCDKVDEMSVRNESSKSCPTNEQPDSSREKSSQSDAKSKISLASNKVETRKVFEYKYECEMCKTKFINKFLQSRHNCIPKVKSTFSCDICQQKFTTVSNLNLHKKTHIKEPPIIRPTLTKIPQVKEVSKKDTVLSGPLVKSSLSSSRSSIIAKAPVKIPSRQSVLPAKHPKPSVKGSRVSLLPPKSKQMVAHAIHLPKQVKIITSEVASESSVEHGNDSNMKEENVPEKNNTTIFKCEKQCDNCSMWFDNHSSWFNHQVLKHGLKTPDKSIGEKKPKKIVKDKVVHNGIRTAPTVAKNFSMLKNMVQHI